MVDEIYLISKALMFQKRLSSANTEQLIMERCDQKESLLQLLTEDVIWHARSEMVQGASKKTSFCENWAWQIWLLIMRNPPSFFLSNAGDSICNSYIYHLVGLHIRQWQSDSNTTSSLKNNKTIWDKFITCTHTFTWRQRTAWNFTCVCKSSIWISHCQQ